jgi:hypothetical protein
VINVKIRRACNIVLGHKQLLKDLRYCIYNNSSYEGRDRRYRSVSDRTSCDY